MISCFMLAEAVFQIIAVDIPIVRPRNLHYRYIYMYVYILTVFPSSIENTAEETMRWPLKLRMIHFGGWNSRHMSISLKTNDDKTR